jgi:hypothetical protein
MSILIKMKILEDQPYLFDMDKIELESMTPSQHIRYNLLKGYPIGIKVDALEMIMPLCPSAANQLLLLHKDRVDTMLSTSRLGNTLFLEGKRD